MNNEGTMRCGERIAVWGLVWCMNGQGEMHPVMSAFGK